MAEGTRRSEEMSGMLDDLLESYRDWYGTYHHHKEQLAYSAATLYLAAATWIVVQGPSVWTWPLPPCAVAVLFMSSAVAAFSFVVWQLTNRKFAARVVSACTSIQATRLTSAGTVMDLTPIRYKYGYDLPAVLVHELDSIYRSGPFLPGPWISEYLTYAIMLAWSIGAVASVA